MLAPFPDGLFLQLNAAAESTPTSGVPIQQAFSPFIGVIVPVA